MQKFNSSIISGTLIERSKRAVIFLPRNLIETYKVSRIFVEMDIILKQTMKEIWNIFISLDLSWIKTKCLLEKFMACSTHILIQLKYMSW